MRDSDIFINIDKRHSAKQHEGFRISLDQPGNFSLNTGVEKYAWWCQNYVKKLNAHIK